MRYLALAPLLLLAAPSAYAADDVCGKAQEYLKCYHSTSKFTKCEAIAPDKARVYLQGGLTGKPYQLEYQVETKDTFQRVVLLKDDSTVPASQKCPFANWSPK